MPPRKARETALSFFITEKKKERKDKKESTKSDAATPEEVKPEQKLSKAEIESLEAELTKEFEQLSDELQQRYTQKAAQVNEQRARARASRLKRKKETTVLKADEAAKAHMLEIASEGTLDPEAYRRLQAQVATTMQGKPLAKRGKVAPFSQQERLEVTYTDGTPCVMHQDLVFRTTASFGPKLL
eukprot:m.27997 g.27997  ORF g.27997 m.27997 type:complete len:185 (-) comp11800_c0_seq1:116-670(-)